MATTTPHGGVYPAKHHRHKTREVGEGHHHAQRSLQRWIQGKKRRMKISTAAFTPFPH